MQKLNLTQNKQEIVFFALAGFLALELLVLFPWTIKRVISLSKKNAAAYEQLRQFQRDWPNKDKYLNDNEQLKEEIKSLQGKFIFPKQESKLFSFISASSKDFDVKIQSLLPGNLQDYTEAKPGEFKYLPINIKADGSFHNLARFLEFLRNSRYFLEVKELSISANHSLTQSQNFFNLIEMKICAIIREK